jgi:acyl-CoA thioester hydrolase
LEVIPNWFIRQIRIDSRRNCCHFGLDVSGEISVNSPAEIKNRFIISFEMTINIELMKEFDFELEMQVRDYECDIQGIVNNANYMHYLEHCRHLFLKNVGLDFAHLHNEGIDAVVIRAEIDYKFPLRPGDDFFVRLKMARQGNLRLIFDQKIVSKNDGKVMVLGKITSVLTKNNRPVSPEILLDHFTKAGIEL